MPRGSQGILTPAGRFVALCPILSSLGNPRSLGNGRFGLRFCHHAQEPDRHARPLYSVSSVAEVTASELPQPGRLLVLKFESDPFAVRSRMYSLTKQSCQ